MIIWEFAILIKQNNKFIIQNIQMHFLLHNPTYYKYNAHNFKVFRFDFL